MNIGNINKKIDFKSIQNDNYKLIKFIRDKYEFKKLENKKKKSYDFNNTTKI